jgi:hypothetical protein
MAVSDFFLFDDVRRALYGKKLQNVEQLLETVMHILNEIPWTN